VGLYYNYKIESQEDIKNVIIPHFERYPLLSINKYKSFYLLVQCINIIYRNKNMTKEEFLMLLSYKASFKLGLKSKVFEVLKDISVVKYDNIPEPNYSIINPYWLAGFVAGDGSFGAYLNRRTYDCTFRISQDKIDQSLLVSIKDFLSCGKVFKFKTGMCGLTIRSLNDLNTKIIPLFKKYKLETSKEIDFFYFQKIVNVFNEKGFRIRLSKEEIEKIRILTKKMNNSRREKFNI
jgi:hypothetical protein